MYICALKATRNAITTRTNLTSRPDGPRKRGQGGTVSMSPIFCSENRSRRADEFIEDLKSKLSSELGEASSVGSSDTSQINTEPSEVDHGSDVIYPSPHSNGEEIIQQNEESDRNDQSNKDIWSSEMTSTTNDEMANDVKQKKLDIQFDPCVIEKSNVNSGVESALSQCDSDSSNASVISGLSELSQVSGGLKQCEIGFRTTSQRRIIRKPLIIGGCISPDHFLKNIWDGMVAVLIFYTIIVVPYTVSFEVPYNETISVIDWALDVFFFIDLLSSFFTAVCYKPPSLNYRSQLIYTSLCRDPSGCIVNQDPSNQNSKFTGRRSPTVVSFFVGRGRPTDKYLRCHRNRATIDSDGSFQPSDNTSRLRDRIRDRMIIDYRTLAVKYITGWFCVDLISTIPFDRIAGSGFGDSGSDKILDNVLNSVSLDNSSSRLREDISKARLLKLARLCKLLKLLRIFKLLKLRYVSTKFPLNPGIRKLVLLILSIMILAHVLACGWYWIATPICDLASEGNGGIGFGMWELGYSDRFKLLESTGLLDPGTSDSSNEVDPIWNHICKSSIGTSSFDTSLLKINESWVTEFGVHRTPLMSRYIVSFYFVVTSMMGSGYGDFHPTTDGEKIYSIIVQLAGAIAFGFILASITVLLETWVPRSAGEKEKLKSLDDWMGSRNFKKNLKSRIRDQLAYSLNRKNICYDNETVVTLPDVVIDSLNQLVFKREIESIKLLRCSAVVSSPRFVFDFMDVSIPLLAVEGDIILRADDLCDNVFIIIRGEVEAYSVEERNIGLLRRLRLRFSAGDHFGLSPLLFREYTTLEYKATMVTDLLRITSQALDGLMTTYGSFFDYVWRLTNKEVSKIVDLRRRQARYPQRDKPEITSYNSDVVSECSTRAYNPQIPSYLAIVTGAVIPPNTIDDFKGGSDVHANDLILRTHRNLKVYLNRCFRFGLWCIKSKTRNVTSSIGDRDAQKSKTCTPVAETAQQVRTIRLNDKGETVLADESSREIWSRWIIFPESRNKINWDIFIGFLIVLSIIMIPYRIGFNIDLTDWGLTTDILVDVLFAMDIALSFCTGFFSRDGYLVTVRRLIAKKYLRSWFLVDLVSTVPIDHIVQAFLANNNEDNTTSGSNKARSIRLVRVVRLSRLVRLFRVLRLARVIHQIERLLLFTPVVARVVNLLLQLSVLAHLIACIFHLLAIEMMSSIPSDSNECQFGTRQCVQTQSPLTWVFAVGSDISDTPFAPGGDDSENEKFNNYTSSLYWAFTAMTTVGYGDIVPQIDGERIYTIIITVFGASVFGYVVGSIATATEDATTLQNIQKRKYSLLTNWLDSIFSKSGDVREFGKLGGTPYGTGNANKRNNERLWKSVTQRSMVTNQLSGISKRNKWIRDAVTTHSDFYWDVIGTRDESFIQDLPPYLMEDIYMEIWKYFSLFSVISDNLTKSSYIAFIRVLTPQALLTGFYLSNDSEMLFFVVGGACSMEILTCDGIIYSPGSMREASKTNQIDKNSDQVPPQSCETRVGSSGSLSRNTGTYSFDGTLDPLPTYRSGDIMGLEISLLNCRCIFCGSEKSSGYKKPVMGTDSRCRSQVRIKATMDTKLVTLAKHSLDNLLANYPTIAKPLVNVCFSGICETRIRHIQRGEIDWAKLVHF